MSRDVSDELQELYRERAEYADMESTFQDIKKFVWHGGILWRLANWFEQSIAESRREVDEEIKELMRARDAR
jgi:hypothetical protein